MTGSLANLFSFSTRGAQVGAGKSEAEDFLEAVLEVGLPLAGDLGGRLSNRKVNAKSLGGAGPGQGNPVAGVMKHLGLEGQEAVVLVCGASLQGWGPVGAEAQAVTISSLG